MDTSMIDLMLKEWDELSGEEKDRARLYQIKYSLVKFLYLEKVNADGPEKVVDFNFTPGDKFLEIPVIDMINTLLKVREQVNSGELQPTSVFPETGKPKRRLHDD